MYDHHTVPQWPLLRCGHLYVFPMSWLEFKHCAPSAIGVKRFYVWYVMLFSFFSMFPAGCNVANNSFRPRLRGQPDSKRQSRSTQSSRRCRENTLLLAFGRCPIEAKIMYTANQSVMTAISQSIYRVRRNVIF